MDDRRIEGLDSLPSEVASAVLTIGNFDGVHVGHRQILATAKALADAEATSVVALTLDPPPDLVLRPDDVPQRITPPDEQVDLGSGIKIQNKANGRSQAPGAPWGGEVRDWGLPFN